MAYDLSTVRNQVLQDRINDTSYDSSVVDNFINATQRNICNTYALSFTEDVFSGTLPTDEHLFSLPDDYQQQAALKITDPDGKVRDISGGYLQFRQFNRNFPVPADRESGTPQYWALWGGQLYIDKPTDQTYTLDLWYTKTAPTLESNSDVPIIPEEFQETLVLGAYYRVLQREEDYDLAEVHKQEYKQEIDLMVARYGLKQTGTPTKMGQPRRSRPRRP